METYLISNTTQLRYDDNLRIGVGNFWREEYVDHDGETHKGLTAGLWLLATEEGTSSRQHVRVHVGQEVVYDRYVIRVVEIGRGRRAPFVRLAIGPVEEPQD